AFKAQIVTAAAASVTPTPTSTTSSVPFTVFLPSTSSVNHTDSSIHIFFTAPPPHSNTSSSMPHSPICVFVNKGGFTCSITTTSKFTQAFVASYPQTAFFVTSAYLFS